MISKTFLLGPRFLFPVSLVDVGTFSKTVPILVYVLPKRAPFSKTDLVTWLPRWH